MSHLPLTDALRQFVANETWTYAKTWPHEYLVRDRVDAAMFVDLVKHIRTHGYQGTFYKKPIGYFDEDGYVYWTMGEPLDDTDIINRCPKEASYEYRAKHGDLPDRRLRDYSQSQ